MNSSTRQFTSAKTHQYVKLATVVGVLIVANTLGFYYDMEYDLTETGEYSLSDETRTVLDNLTEPVHVVGFFRLGDHRWALAKKYLERYSRYSNLLTYGLHDPEIEPHIAHKYDIDSYTLLFISGQHRYTASKVNEEAITTGLLCVTSQLHSLQNQTLITIDRKPDNRYLQLSPLQMGIVFIVSVVIIPGLTFAAGARAWLGRR